MGVRKIFIVLVTIVACVILGAFVLNTLMPNVVVTVIDATEDMIYKATGLSFDFNSNEEGGSTGATDGNYVGEQKGGDYDNLSGGVEGFGNGTEDEG